MLPVLLLLLFSSTVSSYKILVYNSRFAHSHSNYVGNIADILVDAGHQVDTLIPIIDRNGKDGSKKANPIYVPRETDMEEYKTIFATDIDLFHLSNDDLFGNIFLYSTMGEMFKKQCNVTLHHPGLIQRLTEEKYDLFFSETFDFCGIGIYHLIKAKSLITVATSAFFDKIADPLGVPTAPSFNPAWTTQVFDPHSLVSRAWNYYRSILWKKTFVPMERCDELFQELYGPSFPSLYEIISDSAFYFVNSEPYIDYARPTIKKVVELGGIGAQQPNPLDKALSQFPEVTFIWKYEDLEDSFAKNEVSKVPNVVLHSWIPQNDLLNDTRVSAFITHGGMGSTQETAARGVPGIFIPLFGDQPRNAAMMQHTGMGLVYNKYEVADTNKFAHTIKQILTDESYTLMARRISRMLANRPFQPRDVLIRYAQFAAEFGASRNLKPLSHDLSLVEYYMLDVFALGAVLVLTVLTLLGYLSYLILFNLLRYIVFSKSKVE